MIELSTIKFLENLSLNNEREWFNDNKADYESARDNVLDFTSVVISGISRFDPTVPTDLNPKTCVMRIYRDIRFSKDKTPMKTNFGIGISSNGKNFKGPGYYIHIQPEKSFIAGGSWFPEAEELKAIRQEIDYNGSALKEILENATFKKVFGELDLEGALKTTPKGYDEDNEYISYLKLKSFTTTHFINDKELSQSNSAKMIVDKMENLFPLMGFLRNAIV